MLVAIGCLTQTVSIIYSESSSILPLTSILYCILLRLYYIFIVNHLNGAHLSIFAAILLRCEHELTIVIPLHWAEKKQYHKVVFNAIIRKTIPNNCQRPEDASMGKKSSLLLVPIKLVGMINIGNLLDLWIFDSFVIAFTRWTFDRWLLFV